MKMKALLIGGVIVIAAVAGILEGLAQPRRKNEKEEKKEQGKETSQ